MAEPASKKPCVSSDEEPELSGGEEAADVEQQQPLSREEADALIATAAAGAVPLTENPEPTDRVKKSALERVAGCNLSTVYASGGTEQEMLSAIAYLNMIEDADWGIPALRFMHQVGKKYVLPPLDHERLRATLLAAIAEGADDYEEDEPPAEITLRNFLDSFAEDLRFFPVMMASQAITPDHLKVDGIRAMLVVMIWRVVQRDAGFVHHLWDFGRVRRRLTRKATDALSAENWVKNFPYLLSFDLDEIGGDFGSFCGQFYALDALRILKMMVEEKCDFFLKL